MPNGFLPVKWRKYQFTNIQSYVALNATKTGRRFGLASVSHAAKSALDANDITG